MKINLLLATLFLFFISCAPKTDELKSAATQVVNKTKSVVKKKQLRHLVMIKFKETSSAEDIAKVETAFAALPSQISQITDFEWGINNSPEGLDKGFTHVFFISFDDEEGRDVYLPHPAHKAFVEVLVTHLDEVMVMDYWSK